MNVVKISFPRPVPQGSLRDRDVHAPVSTTSRWPNSRSPDRGGTAGVSGRPLGGVVVAEVVQFGEVHRVHAVIVPDQ